jgi:hemolysin III
MSIRRYKDASFKSFFKRTIAAQIHFIGFLAAVVGFLVLALFSWLHLSRIDTVAVLIFSFTSILVFSASATYHFLSDGYHLSPGLKKWLRNLDHFSIYLFIAGSYTPILLTALTSPAKENLLVIVWSIAVSGIIYTLVRPKLPLWAQHRMVYTLIFVLMGWTILPYMNVVARSLSAVGFFLFLAEGASYTIGAVIYATKRPKLLVGVFGFHELWHFTVLMGAVFHYFLILDIYWR